MKMEGGYHGSFELAEVSLVPMPDARGDLSAPRSTAVDASFPDSVLGDTVVCPYNQPDLARQLIDAHAAELAAIIVEPVLGSMGMVPATSEFLAVLRERASAHNIVLVFDEVITLRLSVGGAQAPLGISPDLTCMGKIVGGGLPVGAVGGKASLMDEFNPNRPNPVMHASTFSGNALTMAAGLAAMQALTEAEIERINGLGARLREGFDRAFSQAGIRGCAAGQGSLANLHFLAAPPDDSRAAMDGMIAGGHIAQLLHLGMLRRGVLSATRLMYCTSTAMTDADVEFVLTAFAETLAELLPVIEQERQVLLA